MSMLVCLEFTLRPKNAIIYNDAQRCVIMVRNQKLPKVMAATDDRIEMAQ